MQSGKKDIENLIVIMVLEKLLKKDTNMKKYLSMSLR
jgi:hypothetical protein